MSTQRPQTGIPRTWLYLFAGKLVLVAAVVIGVVVYASYR